MGLIKKMYSIPESRLKEWDVFYGKVADHIRDYTVPQYGKKGEDQVSSMTPQDISVQIKRYANRVGSDQRGMDNALMDCFKMAHYSCMLYWMYLENMNAQQELA